MVGIKELHQTNIVGDDRDGPNGPDDLTPIFANDETSLNVAARKEQQSRAEKEAAAKRKSDEAAIKQKILDLEANVKAAGRQIIALQTDLAKARIDADTERGLRTSADLLVKDLRSNLKAQLDRVDDLPWCWENETVYLLVPDGGVQGRDTFDLGIDVNGTIKAHVWHFDRNNTNQQIILSLAREGYGRTPWLISTQDYKNKFYQLNEPNGRPFLADRLPESSAMRSSQEWRLTFGDESDDTYPSYPTMFIQNVFHKTFICLQGFEPMAGPRARKQGFYIVRRDTIQGIV